MKLYCPECSQALGQDDLCRHRNPVGECCCPDVHGLGDDQYDQPEEAA